MDRSEIVKLKASVAVYFKPGTPIDNEQLFAGRQSQIKNVMNAVIQPGLHVIMYGDRGVGKTSLAKVVSDIMRGAEIFKTLNSGTINCDPADNFDSLWRKIFRELSIEMESQEAGFQKQSLMSAVPFAENLPEQKLQPDDIRHFLSKIKASLVLVIDELDSLSDQTSRSQLANTIKNLSDHAIDTTLVLVGVGDSVDELINEHESIQRSLVQVKMQRMSPMELMNILEIGERGSGITFPEECKIWITSLSQGLPHYTHLLGLYSSFSAIEDRRTGITLDDVLAATTSIVHASQTVASAYHKAISSPRTGNIYAKVLSACALASTDEQGYFKAAGVCKSLSKIMNRECRISDFSRHLTEFCERKRGPILKSIGDKWNRRYRFIDAMLQPYVIIHDYSIGMLTNQFLEESKEKSRDAVNGQ